MTKQEILNEIADCTAAIQAFSIGCPWLAPNGYAEAPSVEWLKMQQRVLRQKL